MMERGHPMRGHGTGIIFHRAGEMERCFLIGWLDLSLVVEGAG